jgi:cleavage and polyadenylation specificity factor subunit 1
VLPDLSLPVYTLESVGFLPPMLSPEYTGRRYASPESLLEVLVADLGDSGACSPFLIVSSICSVIEYL